MSKRSGNESTPDPDYAPIVRRCIQCDGPAHICEQPDSTCRFAAAARAWLEVSDRETFWEPRKVSLAKLLRDTEDGAWERLSEARTKEVARQRAALEAIRVALGLSADSDAERIVHHVKRTVIERLERAQTIGCANCGNPIRQLEAWCHRCVR